LVASSPSARAEAPHGTKVTVEQLNTVVFLTDESDAATSAVTPAVRAQLSDLPVTLVPVSETLPGDLGARMRVAARVAEERGGQAVFWLEVEASGSVLYFMGQPYNELLSRRLGEAGARGAAIDEEVAVIVRSTVVALLQNEKVDMARVEPPSPPALDRPVASARHREEPPPEPKKASAPPPPPERFRISAGYVGTSFAEASGWQHGATFGIAGFPWKRLLVGARYSVLLPVAVDTDEASLRIYRHPVEVSVGWSLDFAPVYIEPEVAGLFDYRTRSTTATSSDVEKTPDSAQAAFGASPRVRAVFRLFPALSLFATAGVDFYAPQVSYLVRDPAKHELLRSRSILPRVEGGLTLNPF
ncbi:MAG TPA: hypothetical protein VF103_07245, partial [Polyangiaceae bacterium]